MRPLTNVFAVLACVAAAGSRSPAQTLAADQATATETAVRRGRCMFRGLRPL